MTEPTEEEILSNWRAEVEKEQTWLHKKVTDKRNEIREALPNVSIWLGGPGRGTEFYQLRCLIKNLLVEQGFEVVFSEDFRGGADLASKEAEEILSFDVAILIAITAGASAEAIEFANWSLVRKSFSVFMPEEYKGGYVYRSLFGKWGLIREESLFSLERAKKYDSELAIKICRRAIAARTAIFAQPKFRA